MYAPTPPPGRGRPRTLTGPAAGGASPPGSAWGGSRRRGSRRWLLPAGPVRPPPRRPRRLLEHELVVERASVGRPPCKPLAGAPEYIAPTHPRPRHFCEGQRGAEPVPGPERPPELHVQRRQRERRAGAGDEVSVHPTSREELVPAVLEVRGVHGVIHDVVLFFSQCS